MKTIAQQLGVKEFPFIIKNSQGDEIYYEYSDGSFFKYESDAKGNLIYSEDSGGFWSKREYDSQGKLIYFENSEGLIEDNRNIPEYTLDELFEIIGKFKLKTK